MYLCLYTLFVTILSYLHYPLNKLELPKSTESVWYDRNSSEREIVNKRLEQLFAKKPGECMKTRFEMPRKQQRTFEYGQCYKSCMCEVTVLK